MLALVPMRGGSKGIPGKNIKEIAGKPLCQWVIDSALESDVFHRIIVSTDSKEIADVVMDIYGPRVAVVIRPPELAQDDTPSEAVIAHITEYEPYRTMCMIQATCPLTTAYDFRAARSKFFAWGCDSLLSVVRLEKFAWKQAWIEQCVTPVNYRPTNRPMRQQGIEPIYIETGNFYMFYRTTFERHNCRLGNSVGRYVIDPERAIDIDTMEDFKQAEEVLRGRGNEVSYM